MTYTWLNAIFTVIALTLAHFLKGKTNFRFVLLTAAAVLIATAFGDNYIVGSGIVDYDLTKIIGIKIGHAPIEDFAYGLVAAFIVPVVWNIFGKRK